jgi:two-component sensor histidine kinase
MKTYALPPLIMSVVCLTVAAYELLVWTRGKGERRTLSFAVNCVLAACYGIACAGEYNVALPAESIPWLRMQAMVMNLTALSFMWYVARNDGLINRKHFRFFFVLFGVSALASLIPGDLAWIRDRPEITRITLPFGNTIEYLEVEAGPITNIQAIIGLGFFAYLLAVIVRYARLGRHPEARPLVTVTSIITLAYVNDFMVNLGLYEFPYTVEYAWLAVVVLVAIERSRQVRESDAKIVSSLHEKEALLNEVHHRVKNNLQVVSGLLDLEEDRVDDPKVKAVIRDCRDQVISMALIHEDLYKSQDFGRIDFANYIGTLVGRLLSSYRKTGVITFVPEFEPVYFPIDRAIPCGLIVNELCTNVMKYAFPADFSGKPELRISLRNTESGSVVISVVDNGVGIPESDDPGLTKSFGLGIVSMLAEQLHATLQLERNGGTRFTIEVAGS